MRGREKLWKTRMCAIPAETGHQRIASSNEAGEQRPVPDFGAPPPEIAQDGELSWLASQPFFRTQRKRPPMRSAFSSTRAAACST